MLVEVVSGCWGHFHDGATGKVVPVTEGRMASADQRWPGFEP
jgi:hypothetical protein